LPTRLLPPPRILDTGEQTDSIDNVRLAGFDALVPDEVPSDLSLQAIMLEPGAVEDVTEVRLYYAPTPIGEDTTLVDVIADGGMLLMQRVSKGVDAALVQREVGTRAVIVQVGSHDAALIWGDQIAVGIRPYSLYWSDGERDWSLITGFETPENAVSVARSIYCA
jgi:hypothetical protein